MQAAAKKIEPSEQQLIDKTFGALHSSAHGLGGAEAEKGLTQYGYNE